jgi:hypothetical protein
MAARFEGGIMEAPLEGAGLSRERLSRDFADFEVDADPACFFIRARSSAWRDAIVRVDSCSIY